MRMHMCTCTSTCTHAQAHAHMHMPVHMQGMWQHTARACAHVHAIYVRAMRMHIDYLAYVAK